MVNIYEAEGRKVYEVKNKTVTIGQREEVERMVSTYLSVRQGDPGWEVHVDATKSPTCVSRVGGDTVQWR